MADISKINVNNTNYDIKDAVARGLIWQGTQVQYDAITTKNPNVVYFITDGVTVACSADEVLYDNITSGLSATDVQSAIDELSSEKADSSSLAAVATSGSYNDLSNKPTIPAAQVNSDWSAVSGISEILNKPTTLSGYGITDAKIVSGTITLGGNSITPLTQHQSVTDNNPSLTWGTKSKVATIGSTEINVTMPANPNTNTTYTFANGTNGFTVTPSDGTAQTVTVTPDLSSKMDKTNPTGTGALSLNRKANTTVGEYSAVTGLSNEASGNYTHSEGRDNVSSASFAHSEGRYATASNQYTHAEGYQTTASGAAAHAEGSGNTASGLGSHCEGFQNTASGDRSHAEGGYTVANHRSQHVFGEFNVADTSTAVATARGNYIEIVGKGANDANRSNARTLDWQGNETIAGDLIFNGTTSLTGKFDIEKSASDSMVSFTDGGDNIPVKSLIVDITAIQAGSGIPSPSNVRAISGFDTVELVKSGLNIWNEQWEVGTINANSGLPEADNSRVRSKDFILCRPSTSYYALPNVQVLGYDLNKDFVGIVSSSTSGAVFTTPANCYYFKFRTPNTYGNTYNNDLGINYPSTATTYEPYKGTTYAINLGSTVYGGTLDVVNGILTVTHTLLDMGSVDWIQTSVGDYSVYYYIPSDKDDTFDFICSCFKAVKKVRQSLSDLEIGTYNTTNAMNRLTVRYDAVSTAEAFKNAVSGQCVAYRLATPIVINLTKTQVTTLLNENNIYADSGDISVEYFTQSAKNISDVANSSNKMDFSNPTGTGSLSIGRKSGTATGSQSMAVGYGVEASGARAIALGHATTATGDNGSFAEGYNTTASGVYGSHAEGRATTATGDNGSHAEGYGSTASGSVSHAEGQATTASGSWSHAENINTKASGDRSHCEGYQTEATRRSQHVFGEFNIKDTQGADGTAKGAYIEIVGKGSNDANRSNARTLDWSGNEVLAGDLTIKGNQSMGTVANAVYSYRFNSSTPVVLNAYEYASFIIMGYAQGVGAIAVLLIIQNGTIRYTKNMINGSDFSSAEISFTYSNAQLTIASTKAAYSTLTIIKGCP